MAVGVLVAVATLFGLLIGSFLTVVTDRVPRGESIVAPRSRCGACGTTLGPVDLVPVVSWVVLRGRCRRCRSSIGTESLVLELGTAALFAVITLEFQASWAAVAFCILGAGLLALSIIDLRTKRLPREITYMTLALGAPFLVLAALVEDEPRRILTMVAGALIALAFMGIVYTASRGGLGDGDVRLSPLLGAYLGWLGLGYVPVGLFLGFLFGAVVGVAAMAIGTAGRKTAIPFGPFLAAGTIVAVFIGDWVIDVVWR
ncbi:MAG: prepilin peptidase [Ilumatobacteraceae bacterium]|jgi:leader peptidase (prepilin peptidase)/N-methyltransferase